jgi:predicted NBD/HSP70 family sugar kinase
MPSDAPTNGHPRNGHPQDEPTALRAPRNKNTLQVLDVLQRKSPITQPELVEDTELSRGTIASIIRRLYAQELIEAAPSNGLPRPEGGRPPHAVQLRRDAATALSIDFGLRHVYVASGTLLGISASDTNEDVDVVHDSPKAIEAAVPLVEKVMTSIDPRDLVGVCVGLPAPIDQKRQQIASTRGITSWTGLRPAEELRYRLGPKWSKVPFILENDANLMALAEYEFGAARRDLESCQDVVVVVKWSDGIGASVLINGVAVVGFRGLAAEFGHTTVALPGQRPDPPTACRRCGHICLERHAGGEALTARLRKGENDTFGDIVQRAISDEDGPEREAISKAAECIGRALGLYVTLLNPRRIVIGGRHFGIAPDNVSSYRVIADSIRSGMHETGFPPALEDVDIALGTRNHLSAAEGGVIAMMRNRLPRHLARKLAGASH